MDRWLSSRWWERQAALWGLLYEHTNPIGGLHPHNHDPPKGPVSITNRQCTTPCSSLSFTMKWESNHSRCLPEDPRPAHGCLCSRRAPPVLGKRLQECHPNGPALHVRRCACRAVDTTGHPALLCAQNPSGPTAVTNPYSSPSAHKHAVMNLPVPVNVCSILHPGGAGNMLLVYQVVKVCLKEPRGGLRTAPQLLGRELVPERRELWVQAADLTCQRRRGG